MKLLIAEDEAIIRMDLKETLQDLGYEVVAEARSGSEAVQKAFAFAPDCALMDAHMDGDDGFAAAQEIAQAQLCPVVMVTAYAQKDKVKEASKMGVFGYVTKPFAEKDLVAATSCRQSKMPAHRSGSNRRRGIRSHAEDLYEHAQASSGSCRSNYLGLRSKPLAAPQAGVYQSALNGSWAPSTCRSPIRATTRARNHQARHHHVRLACKPPNAKAALPPPETR